MSTAPYPHVEMHVRDESIYTPTASEVLPLAKPLYMMRAQKGPIGVPVWCDTYAVAARVFGEDTFSKRSVYFSEQAYFLLKTFPSNGAFIMRVADSNAHPAEISIELGVSKGTVGVPQWKRDSNGRFVYEIDGSKIPINSDGEECQPTGERRLVYARALEATAIEGETYYTRKENFVYSKVLPTDRRIIAWSYFLGINRPMFTAVDTSQAIDPTALYFEQNDSSDNTWYAKFDLEEFESGKTYIKFIGFEGGYRQAANEELPAYAPGQTIGDKFWETKTRFNKKVTITKPEGSDTWYGDISVSATADAFAKLFFTRALQEENPYTYTEVTIPAGTPLTSGAFYRCLGEIDPGSLEAQATIPGYKLAWRAHVIGSYNAQGVYTRSRPVGDPTEYESDNFTWYPMIDVVAENPGVWGQKFGLRMFFDEFTASVANTVKNSSATYAISPVQLLGDDTTPTPITNKFGETTISGVARPGVIDPESETEISIDRVLRNSYSGLQALPIQFTLIAENWDKVGKLLMKAEIAQRNAIKLLYKDFRTIYNATGDEVAETFVDAIFSKVAETTDCDKADAGYMANVVSTIDGDQIPYFASACVDSLDSIIESDSGLDPEIDNIFTPSASGAIYLGGGNDGSIDDFNVEKQIRAQVTAARGGTQEYLIDYARCPFNKIVDTGVSLQTKKAYLDLLMVRDSLVVDLATQVTWKDATGVAPKANTRYEDESIGAALRAYAWLMKEDVVEGTEACRAKIFLHAGYRTDHDIEKPCAATLWIALKNAEYLNKQYINKEAKELPNSSVDCWEKLSWVASSEDTKSRCWNAGLNYVQFYSMTNYHYAAVRSVYRYETSILVDAGVVDTLTFMKDEIRRSWATWAGSSRPAAELNQLITDDLNSRFSFLLNGKYNFATRVYQTDEDMKLGYARHVDVDLVAPGTNRVWTATIICKRENFNQEEA